MVESTSIILFLYFWNSSLVPISWLCMKNCGGGLDHLPLDAWLLTFYPFSIFSECEFRAWNPDSISPADSDETTTEYCSIKLDWMRPGIKPVHEVTMKVFVEVTCSGKFTQSHEMEFASNGNCCQQSDPWLWLEWVIWHLAWIKDTHLSSAAFCSCLLGWAENRQWIMLTMRKITNSPPPMKHTGQLLVSGDTSILMTKVIVCLGCWNIFAHNWLTIFFQQSAPFLCFSSLSYLFLRKLWKGRGRIPLILRPWSLIFSSTEGLPHTCGIWDLKVSYDDNLTSHCATLPCMSLNPSLTSIDKSLTELSKDWSCSHHLYCIVLWIPSEQMYWKIDDRELYSSLCNMQRCSIN